MSATLDQRMGALANAQRVRIARADLHRVIAGMSQKGGRQHVARLLDDPPEYVASMSLRKFLCWIDRWGDNTVDALLAELQIGQRHDVTVGELVPRQVALLTDVLLGVRA